MAIQNIARGAKGGYQSGLAVGQGLMPQFGNMRRDALALRDWLQRRADIEYMKKAALTKSVTGLLGMGANTYLSRNDPDNMVNAMATGQRFGSGDYQGGTQLLLEQDKLNREIKQKEADRKQDEMLALIRSGQVGVLGIPEQEPAFTTESGVPLYPAQPKEVPSWKKSGMTLGARNRLLGELRTGAKEVPFTGQFMAIPRTREAAIKHVLNRGYIGYKDDPEMMEIINSLPTEQEKKAKSKKKGWFNKSEPKTDKWWLE